MGRPLKVIGALLAVALLTAGALKLVNTEPRNRTEDLASADLGELCAKPGGVSFSDAPPYEGPRPHPIVVVGFNEDPADAGKSWAPAWKPQRAQIQLIGCVAGKSSGNPVLGDSCTFNLPTQREVPIVETTTLVTVYEARTGHQVGQASVPSGSAECPTQLVVGEGSVIEAEPGYEQYAAALRQYVDK
ncbi:hypothetical protein [Kribbella sp. DT2]|uniref:hypothetical protein n=1 Tax=Kribbella sp. DT2 TaxID=3393427 RepID=UPI003CF1004D